MNKNDILADKNTDHYNNTNKKNLGTRIDRYNTTELKKIQNICLLHQLFYRFVNGKFYVTFFKNILFLLIHASYSSNLFITWEKASLNFIFLYSQPLIKYIYYYKPFHCLLITDFSHNPQFKGTVILQAGSFRRTTKWKL